MGKSSATWPGVCSQEEMLRDDVERVERLIQRGHETIVTHKPNPHGVIGFHTLDSGFFSAWQSQCLNFVESRLPNNSPYAREFRDKIKHGYRGTVEAGIGILQSVKEDLQLSAIPPGTPPAQNPIELVCGICERLIIKSNLNNRRGAPRSCFL